MTIKGWRCPDYRVSPQTLDILSSEGFVWDRACSMTTCPVCSIAKAAS